MEASFWHQKWERGDIAFHEGEVNQFLVEHFEKFNLPEGSRVFLPLCGKTRDISWLLSHGYRVVGAELSELAITELFRELEIEPQITKVGELSLFSANNIDVFVGDIFDVSTGHLGPINAIFDRAALVALPTDIRSRYATHLMNITHVAPQLLIAYEYDQLLMDGPPFSINEHEVMQHYGGIYELKTVESKSVAGGLKGKIPSTETVWLLQRADE